MLLTCLDPALLIFQQDQWKTQEADFYARTGALALHRKFVNKHDQQLAMSNKMLAMIHQCFPWNSSYKSISSLRDLRQFILIELGKARIVSSCKQADEIQLQPDDLTCMHLKMSDVMANWKELLVNCIAEELNSECDFQVATWPLPVELTGSEELTVIITCAAQKESHFLPVVYDESSWAKRLVFEDPWPDLQSCVELYFSSSAAMQRYQGVRRPLRFECTTRFWKSVESLCRLQMRRLLVKAIAKKVYGIPGPGLRDEPFRSARRFRVNDFWRVHYRECGDKIVLEEFGRHDMGL